MSCSSRGANTLLPTLVAVGGGLVVSPATGLELGDIKIYSTLGQPLRASIAYALAPNEQISDTCVALHPSRSSGGMPTINRAQIRVADGVISLAGNTVISEPMLTMRVNVDCAYTPRLSREYLLFLDPAGTALEPIAAPAAGSESVRPRETAAAAPKVDTIRPQPDAARKPAAPISTNGRYRVQRGDTLSEIAARIENRPVGLWDAVSALFEANPDAFINNDPNLLKAGSWLELPDFGSAQAVTVAERSSAIATDTSRGIVAAAAASPAAPSAGALPAGALPAGEIPAAVPPAYEPPADAAQSAPAAVEIPATETATTAVSAAADPTAVADADDPFVVGSDPEPVDTGLIPDTDFDIPASSSRPNVPTAVIRTPIAESSSVNWLFWLVGSGVALLIALVLFGRRLSKRLDSAPAPAWPQTGIDSGAADSVRELDFDLSSEPPTEENLALDADLAVGSGLEEGEIDVAENFGFAATTRIDIELPEDTAARSKISATDLISPSGITVEETILESEVLSDDDDYDVLTIFDATGTNLHAVSVDTDNDEQEGDDYSMTQEIDFELLAKDYEDEFTATQALNQEIAKAAEDLASQTRETPVGETDVRSAEPMLDPDATAHLQAVNDDDCDSMTARLLIEEKTVEMPGHETEKTVEMQRRGEDSTVEMLLKSRKAGKR